MAYAMGVKKRLSGEYEQISLIGNLRKRVQLSC